MYQRIYTPCLKKNCAKLFCQNFVKFPPILIFFGRKMAKRLKLCEMHSISTSSNSRHHTIVLNADKNVIKTILHSFLRHGVNIYVYIFSACMSIPGNNQYYHNTIITVKLKVTIKCIYTTLF